MTTARICRKCNSPEHHEDHCEGRKVEIEVDVDLPDRPASLEIEVIPSQPIQPVPPPVQPIDRIITVVIACARREDTYPEDSARMFEQVKFYNYGRRSEIPPEWKYFELLVDPEYEHFQRLKKKFEG